MISLWGGGSKKFNETCTSSSQYTANSTANNFANFIMNKWSSDVSWNLRWAPFAVSLVCKSIKHTKPPTPPAFILGADIKFAIVFIIKHKKTIFIKINRFARK